VRAGATLLHQPLGEEALQQSRECGLVLHDDFSQRRSSRDSAWAINEGSALRYQ
jgi:hypothetical protein